MVNNNACDSRRPFGDRMRNVQSAPCSRDQPDIVQNVSTQWSVAGNFKNLSTTGGGEGVFTIDKTSVQQTVQLWEIENTSKYVYINMKYDDL